MLQNFTNEEIEDLVHTGHLYLEVTGFCFDETIKAEARENIHGVYIDTIYVHTYTMMGSGERRSPWYTSLTDLLFCEYITFDNIRRDWKYYGLLLDNPKFKEKCEQN